MHLNRSPFANSIDLLVRLAFDIHLVNPNIQYASEVGTHRFFDWCQFRLFENYCGIKIDELVACARHSSFCFSQKNLGILRSVARISIGEKLSDVRQTECSQNCVGHRVIQGITIRVRDRAAAVGQLHTAEYERFALAARGESLQAVQVVAMSDAQCLHNPSVPTSKVVSLNAELMPHF